MTRLRVSFEWSRPRRCPVPATRQREPTIDAGLHRAGDPCGARRERRSRAGNARERSAFSPWGGRSAAGGGRRRDCQSRAPGRAPRRDHQSTRHARRGRVFRYRGLWQVEERFRITRHDLRVGPIWHWTPDRIRAHTHRHLRHGLPLRAPSRLPCRHPEAPHAPRSHPLRPHRAEALDPPLQAKWKSLRHSFRADAGRRMDLSRHGAASADHAVPAG